LNITNGQLIGGEVTKPLDRMDAGRDVQRKVHNLPIPNWRWTTLMTLKKRSGSYKKSRGKLSNFQTRSGAVQHILSYGLDPTLCEVEYIKSSKLDFFDLLKGKISFLKSRGKYFYLNAETKVFRETSEIERFNLNQRNMWFGYQRLRDSAINS